MFRSGASLVALNVTVTDGKRLVPDLRPDDFAVYEDGVLQRVQFFEARQVPIDLILLLDTSSSMSDKMAVVHEAAIGFLKTLRDTDRGAVVTFGDNVSILQALTSDRTALEQAVRRAAPRGSTALNNALYVAMKEFAASSQQDGVVRRQAIAVLSDGEDTSSIIPFEDVLAMARKSGINIYTICLQNQYSQGARRQRPPLFLRVGLRDEVARPRNRGPGVLPAGRAGAQDGVRRDFRRAVQPVLDRLLAEQRASRRAFPAHRDQARRAPGVPAADPARRTSPTPCSVPCRP